MKKKLYHVDKAHLDINRALGKVALEIKSRRGPRGSYKLVLVMLAKNLTKVLSIVISMNVVSFLTFEKVSEHTDTLKLEKYQLNRSIEC